MILLDGKATAEAIKKEIASQVEKIVASGGRRPHLAAIIVGEDGASKTYVASKEYACERVGFDSTVYQLPTETSEEELLNLICRLPIFKHQDSLLLGMIFLTMGAILLLVTCTLLPMVKYIQLLPEVQSILMLLINRTVLAYHVMYYNIPFKAHVIFMRIMSTTPTIIWGAMLHKPLAHV